MNIPNNVNEVLNEHIDWMAVNVMGWLIIKPDYDSFHYLDEADNFKEYSYDWWNPFENINHAFQLVDKVREDGEKFFNFMNSLFSSISAFEFFSSDNRAFVVAKTIMEVFMEAE